MVELDNNCIIYLYVHVAYQIRVLGGSGLKSSIRRTRTGFVSVWVCWVVAYGETRSSFEVNGCV